MKSEYPGGIPAIEARFNEVVGTKRNPEESDNARTAVPIFNPSFIARENTLRVGKDTLLCEERLN